MKNSIEKQIAGVDPFELLFHVPTAEENEAYRIFKEEQEEEIKRNEEIERQRKAEICPKCSGNGKIPAYYHIENGICFMCGGTGKKR